MARQVVLHKVFIFNDISYDAILKGDDVLGGVRSEFLLKETTMTIPVIFLIILTHPCGDHNNKRLFRKFLATRVTLLEGMI